MLFNVSVKEFNNDVCEGTLVCPSLEVLSHELFNEKSFYGEFLKDLENAMEQVTIESPYLTASRASSVVLGLARDEHRSFYSL